MIGTSVEKELKKVGRIFIKHVISKKIFVHNLDRIGFIRKYL